MLKFSCLLLNKKFFLCYTNDDEHRDCFAWQLPDTTFAMHQFPVMRFALQDFHSFPSQQHQEKTHLYIAYYFILVTSTNSANDLDNDMI
jgi:hypothetical protein